MDTETLENLIWNVQRKTLLVHEAAKTARSVIEYNEAVDELEEAKRLLIDAVVAEIDNAGPPLSEAEIRAITGEPMEAL